MSLPSPSPPAVSISFQYAISMLMDGYGFPAGSTDVDFVRKIDGKSVGWTLGFMINQTTILFPPAPVEVCFVRSPIRQARSLSLSGTAR